MFQKNEEYKMANLERKYAKSHEWVIIEDGVATVGISDHAQEALGDITFVEFPEMSDELEAGGDAAVVESVKAASDIYSPISGTVTAINEELEDAPEKINESPLDEGWLFKLSSINESDLENLMSGSEYDTFLESEK
jgi:glycine cleavage system H protein